MRLALTSSREGHWRQLFEAHHAIRRAEYQRSMDIYEHLLRYDVRIIYAPSTGNTYLLSDNGDIPSLNWACVYLGEYCIQRRKWRDWNKYAGIVFSHPEYTQLSAECQSRLTGFKGWGDLSFSRNQSNLYNIISVQKQALEKQGDTSHLAKALHHLVIGQAYKSLRDDQNSLKHLVYAAELVPFELEPFYALFAQECLGDTYYFLNQKDPTYFQKAIDIYTAAEVLARSFTGSVDFLSQAYNLGWVFAEMGDFDTALHHFQRGYEEACQFLGSYERAIYQYGMGFVYHRTNKPEKSLNALHNAIDYFWDESYLMTAACLNLIAAVLENSDMDTALEHIEIAYDNICRADNPVQRHHVVQRLMKIYFKRRNFRRSLRFLIEMYALRLDIDLKLWPL